MFRSRLINVWEHINIGMKTRNLKHFISHTDMWMKHAVYHRICEPWWRHYRVTTNITVLSVMQVIIMLKWSTIGWTWAMLIAMVLRLIAMIFERTSMPKHNVYVQQKPWQTPCAIIQISSIKHCHYITPGCVSNVDCNGITIGCDDFWTNQYAKT